MRFTRLLAAAPIVALGLAGCGQEATSKKDYIAKADQTCKDLAAEGRALRPKFKAGTIERGTLYPRSQSAILDKLASERVKRFKALELPSDDSDHHRAQVYTKALQQVSRSIDELTTLAREQENAIEPAITRIETIIEQKARRNKRGPGLRPATEEEAKDNRRLLKDQGLVRTASNRVNEKFNAILLSDNEITEEATGFGMKTCGERSLFASVI